VAASALFVTGRATVTTTVDQIVSIAAGQTLTESGGRVGTAALIKRGGGTLVITGANAHSGGTIVEEGDLVIRDVGALGSGTLEVRAGARVTLDVGLGEVVLPALVIEPLGRIDLGAGRLSYASAGVSEATVRQMLVAGFNEGTWDGFSGFTSRAAIPGSGRTLGYLIASGSITIAYAAAGDANLDGVVDIADMASFVANIDAPDLVEVGWNAGDFNYDGLVDQLDLSDFLGTGLFDEGYYLSGAEAAFASFGVE
jgi:autotransporter-associated beta strand protein